MKTINTLPLRTKIDCKILLILSVVLITGLVIFCAVDARAELSN